MNRMIITSYIVHSYQQNQKQHITAYDGDIFSPIKSKIESLDAFLDDIIEGRKANSRKTTSFVDLQFSLKQ